MGVSFEPPARVRVLRVRSRDADTLAEVGRGTLIDRLAVGQHFRVVIDGRPTLTTSAVQRLEHRGDDSIQIETANSVYLLESEAAGTDVEAKTGVADTTRRLNQLVLRGRFAVAGLSERIGADGSIPRDGFNTTRSVSLASAPRPGAGPFHSGVAIRVTRIRGGGRLGCEVGDLGTALLLDDLTMGEPARFALSDGPTVATSPVCGLEKLGGRAVQLVTRNSTYRFELIGPGVGTSGLHPSRTSGKGPSGDHDDQDPRG